MYTVTLVTAASSEPAATDVTACHAEDRRGPAQLGRWGLAPAMAFEEISYAPVHMCVTESYMSVGLVHMRMYVHACDSQTRPMSAPQHVRQFVNASSERQTANRARDGCGARTVSAGRIVDISLHVCEHVQHEQHTHDVAIAPKHTHQTNGQECGRPGDSVLAFAEVHGAIPCKKSLKKADAKSLQMVPVKAAAQGCCC